MGGSAKGGRGLAKLGTVPCGLATFLLVGTGPRSRLHLLVSMSIWRARLCVCLHASVRVCMYVLMLGGGTRWVVGVEV